MTDISPPRVRALLHPQKGDVEVRPLGLSDVLFAAYRAGCSGAKYDRARKCQVVAKKRWPALRKRLADMGFAVLEDTALAKLGATPTEAAPDPELETRVREVERRTGLVLYDYQHEGVRFLSGRRGALLADEQGLGKTLQTCLALPRGASVLVVAPAVAQGVWRDAVQGPPGRPERALRPDFQVVTAKEVGTLPVPLPGRFALATFEDTVSAFRPLDRPKTVALCRGERTDAPRSIVIDPYPARLENPLPPLWKKPLSELQKLAAPHLRARLPCARRSPMVPEIRQHCARWYAACRAFERKPPAYDVLVCDEAHFLKNPKSQRNNAFRALADVAQRVWLLTGTPLPSRPPELWAVLDAADLAERAFGLFGDFATLFGAQEVAIERWDSKAKEKKTIRHLEWPKERDAEAERRISEEAQASLARVMLRRTKAQKLDLPDKVYRTVPVSISQKATTLLEQARAQVLAELGVDLALDEDVDEKVPFSAIAQVRAEVAMAKLPALLELLDLHEEAGERILVFSSHIAPLRKVAARKGWATITGETPQKERREAERAFQAGELVGIACSTLAAGTALTLHRATVEVFLDRDWVPANNAQAEDRAHRIGTDHVVTVEDLVSDHPIDRHVTEVLTRKARLIAVTFTQSSLTANEPPLP
jgi:hypothetical protein